MKVSFAAPASTADIRFAVAVRDLSADSRRSAKFHHFRDGELGTVCHADAEGGLLWRGERQEDM